MSSRITTPAGLPEWFDTTKYVDAILLDARGWYEQIVTRRQCYSMVWHARIEDDDLDDDSIYGVKPSELLNAVRSNPIFDFFGSEFHEAINSKLAKWTLDQPDHDIGPPGVRGITALDVANLIRELSVDERSEFLQWLEARLDEDPHGFHSIKYSETDPEWITKPLGGLTSHPVTVSSYLPDKLLRESFDLYLKHNIPRLDHSFFKSKSDPSYLKGKPKRSNMHLEWCNCGLLQYMDLQTWSLETDTAITNKALASGIFPNNFEKGEENIRTTTKNHSEHILDEGVEVSD